MWLARTLIVASTAWLPASALPAQGTVYLYEDFDDNDAGWTLDTEWQIGPAQLYVPPGSCGFGDPGSDADPGGATEGIAGVVIGGPAGVLPHGYYYLTSPSVDASGAAPLYLEFWRWLNSDFTPYMQNQVQVFDGSAWITIWESGGFPSVSDWEWTYHVYDISALANAALRVRFGHRVVGGGAFTDCGSWNLDEVSFADTPQILPDPQFLRGDGNGDGAVNIGDPIHHLAYLFTFGPSNCLDAQDANDDGSTNIADAVYSLGFQFASGPPLPPPTGFCGDDPTADALSCVTPGSCP